MPDPEPILCFLEDSRSGHQSIIAGVKEQLAKDYLSVVVKVESSFVLPTFIATLFPFFSKKTKQELQNLKNLKAIIGAGRRTIPAAFFLKKLNKNAKLIHLTMPDFFKSSFNLIVDSSYSKSGSNIISFMGAPNKITDSLLKSEQDAFNNKIQNFAQPITSVLLGGNTKDFTYSNTDSTNLTSNIINIYNQLGGTILLVASRRTPPDFEASLRENLSLAKVNFTTNLDSKNPYITALAISNTIIVTGDSISMMSEVASLPTTTNSYVYMPINATKKYLKLKNALCEHKYLKDVSNFPANREAQLNVTASVTNYIKKIIA